ncbi:hypothetical protein MtrunA17_Chr7g0234691 [Medicago truncatula]|uniref:DUF506 family protein n=2 Tax=Medicago truncatula TaxID=3880 RepID=A0A396GX75_MEDTR|nr:hypothetical protein MtrunA17_Chr7g0234691 [Medicago truncatula]
MNRKTSNHFPTNILHQIPTIPFLTLQNHNHHHHSLSTITITSLFKFTSKKSMAVFSRNKRITNLFNNDARARLIIVADQDKLNSGVVVEEGISLSALVHGFLEEHTNGNDDSVANEFDSDRVDSFNDFLALKRLNDVFSNNAHSYKTTLLKHVTEASENFAFFKERNASIFRRKVAEFLREEGHDAAVCVTKWEPYDGAVTAGSHEFIDVVQTRSATATWRYFVDLDFRAQFEIVKPTRRYSEVLNLVPGVFVGGEIELKRTVSIVCDAVKRCFKSKEASIPPWRKNRFMQNKWFGPSKRTVNPVQGKPVRVNGVSCRLLGFDDVVMEIRRGGGVTVRAR